MRRPAAAITMWVVIILGKRTEWINYNTIRRTRKEAEAAYFEGYEPQYLWTLRAQRNSTWRTARVTVTPSAI